MNSPRHHYALLQLKAGHLVKAIAGIGNSNKQQVLQLAEAANASQAIALDVQASPALVKAVRAVFEGVLFASSLDPQDLANAIVAGADIAELGNYDELYERHQYISAESVLSLAEITLQLLPADALLCVTIPGHLHSDCQVELAQRLEAMGVTMLQTEGAARKLSRQAEMVSLPARSKAEQSMVNAARLTAAVSIPVICSTGIAVDNASQAIAHGASGVGVGRAWRSRPSVEWVSYLNEVQAQVRLAEMALVKELTGTTVSYPFVSLSSQRRGLVSLA
jgi:hypothetical protein